MVYTLSLKAGVYFYYRVYSVINIVIIKLIGRY